jgi:hypothetical protein
MLNVSLTKILFKTGTSNAFSVQKMPYPNKVEIIVYTKTVTGSTVMIPEQGRREIPLTL